MVSDIIHISKKDEASNDKALDLSRRVSLYKELSRKSMMHLRLLTEELLGMMRTVTGESNGQFWIEAEGDEYKLHLKVDTLINAKERKHLLSAATSGKNEASRTLMGRLSEFFFRGADEGIANFNNPLLASGASSGAALPVTDWEWSLAVSRNTLSPKVAAKDEAALEAWDELEKSVVTHVADDVKVYIKGGGTEVVLIKKMQ